MEEKKKGKGVKVFLVIFIILFVIAALALGYGYMKYKDLKTENTNLNTKYENISKDLEKTKSDLEESNKNLEKVKKAEDESYGSEYAYKLKDISCELKDNICTKNLKVKYNNKNHSIKVVQDLKKSKKPTSYTSYSSEDDDDEKIAIYSYAITYKLYEDDNLLESINGGVYEVEETSDLLANNINFDGYIYIFDKKYLGFLHREQHPWGSVGYILNLYNNSEKIKNIIVDQPAHSFGKNGSGLDGLKNIKFDGSKLNFWTLNCKKYNKAINVNLTFDGKDVTVKSTGNTKKAVGGGAEVAACYDVNKGTYKGSD